MDFEKLFLSILALAVAGAMMLSGVAIFSDHSVQRYYVGEPTSKGGTVYSINGQINWSPDDTVFQSDDINKVMDVCERLNKDLEIKKP